MRKKLAYSFVCIFCTILVMGCSKQSVEEIPADGPVFEEELQAKLIDPRLLDRLGTKEIIILEIDAYRVTIGSPESREPLGELFYTIQDGWHLKAENEVMEFVPGEGWLIAEQ